MLPPASRIGRGPVRAIRSAARRRPDTERRDEAERSRADRSQADQPDYSLFEIDGLSSPDAPDQVDYEPGDSEEPVDLVPTAPRGRLTARTIATVHGIMERLGSGLYIEPWEKAMRLYQRIEDSAKRR